MLFVADVVAVGVVHWLVCVVVCGYCLLVVVCWLMSGADVV